MSVVASTIGTVNDAVTSQSGSTMALVVASPSSRPTTVPSGMSASDAMLLPSGEEICTCSNGAPLSNSIVVWISGWPPGSSLETATVTDGASKSWASAGAGADRAARAARASAAASFIGGASICATPRALRRLTSHLCASVPPWFKLSSIWRRSSG
jgi:hypothetical protein